MQAELSLKAAFYRARQHHHKTWRKVVTVLASIVVFCTTYALILPAITMEPDYICGLEVHAHEDSCYQLPEAIPVTSMVCDPTALGIHEHTEDCYDEQGELTCGLADFVLHTHGDDCYDADGEPVCPLPEVAEHIHTTEACWQQPHAHEELCYTKHQGELLCTIEEGAVHAHGDGCYTLKQSWLCQLEEVAPHTHNDACYAQTRELACKLEVTEGHAHSDTCYDENNAVICGLPEIAGHAHSDECYQVTETLTCTLEETLGHTHDGTCFETVQELTCAQEAGIPHAHGEACYAWTSELTCTQLTAAEGAVSVLICEEQELYVHTHETACYGESGELFCGLLEVSEHTHDGTCFVISYEQPTEPVLVCELEVHEHTEACLPQEENADSTQTAGTYCGLEEHTHQDACRAEDGTLMCTMTAHTHEELCWLAPADLTAVETEEEWLADLPELTGDIAADLIAVAQSQLGYEQSEVNYMVTEDGEILYYNRYAAWWSYGEDPYGHWNAKFVAFCLENAGITSVPLEPETATWPQMLGYYDQWYDNDGTFAPITADLVFFDTNNDGTADRAGIITEVDTENSTIRVILERRGLVQEVNYDLADGDILGYARIPGNEPATVEANLTEAAQNVIDQIDALPTYEEYVAQLEAYYDADDMEGEEAYATAVTQQAKAAYEAYSLLSPEEQAAVTNAAKLMKFENVWSVATLAVTTNSPTVFQINSYVDPNSDKAVIVTGGTVAEKVTYQFLNWYAIKVEKDSSGYLRVIEILQPGVDKSNYKANNTGFILLLYYTQVIPDASVGDYVCLDFNIPSSGAYKAAGYGTVTFSSSAMPTEANWTSTSDFIELNLYDYNYYINSWWKSNNKYPGFQWNGGAYSKTDYRYYDSTADEGVPNYTTDRNRIDSIDFGNSLITNFSYGNTSDYAKSVNAQNVTGNGGLINAIDNTSYGVTNRPIGFSTGTEVLKRTLVNGYPALADGTSLSYLFGDDTADTYNAVSKLNTSSIDGLFLQNSVTGEYSYNSRENHAQFRASDNRFIRYNQIITPNFITYPFGNFLPLNSISDLSKATQVGSFNYAGGMKEYVNNIKARLTAANESLGSSDWKYTTRNQLKTMLDEYAENWNYYTYNGTWSAISPANAIRDYFQMAGDNPSDDVCFVTQAHLDNMYNIDWNVETNFFFGMEMKMQFYQPKDGMTGTDKDNDGDFDYPMEFNFTGDDDVWVYIDDVLFLDLSGIHRHVGGQIDFVNGKVHYYALDTATGDVSSTPYATYTFAQILSAAGKSTSGLNSKGTFTDYTTHTFNFYYMERGSGSSVCRLNFNFPLLRQNTISVEKELTNDSNILGNPDFMFQVLDVDDNGNKTDNLFLPGNWAYSLYDVDGSLLQEIVVKEKYADGRVKSMEIKDATGTVICTETYDDDGTRTSQTGSGKDKVLRIGENGIFKLKAGQRAEFVGIPETWGKYYVRELLEGTVLKQYGAITVSGVATDPKTVTVGGVQFTGAESPILDMTNGSSTFRFDNKITTANLGTLNISKALTEFPQARVVKYFDIEVTLDGEKLPVGTKYTVGGTTKTVETAGIITIAAGETATISNILAGTAFTVQETSGSAEGYTVTYTDSGGYTITVNDGKVNGVIKTSANVQLVVTNSEKGATVTIPGTKSLANPDGKEHTYTFALTEVTDSTGATVKEGGLTGYEAKATVTDTIQAFSFTINYAQVDVGSLPAKFYYRITENTAGDTVADVAYYVAEVTVTQANDGTLSAAVTGMWKDGAKIETLSADFVNTLVGSLTLSKTVVGADLTDAFTFTIATDPKLSGEYPAVKADGAETTVKFTDGVATVNLTDGQTVTIQNIPYGTKWTITETGNDGYAVTHTVDGVNADGAVSTGSITTGNTVVAYTNSAMYALPETGGGGAAKILFCGGMLMTFPLLLLGFGRRRRHRGRRVQGG